MKPEEFPQVHLATTVPIGPTYDTFLQAQFLVSSTEEYYKSFSKLSSPAINTSTTSDVIRRTLAIVICFSFLVTGVKSAERQAAMKWWQE